jgi:hypothetical protein
VTQGPSIVPFGKLDHRTLWLRAALLNACFFGLIASAPLWTNVHTFPKLPIVPGFPILPQPWDKVFFGMMLASLVAAAWFYRQAVIFFLATSLFAYCEDENRGQPWIYMYWVMLVLTLFPVRTAIAACRIGMSIVYIWSGIQKCNANFFNQEPASFVAPAAHWHLPAIAIELMKAAVWCTPFIELGIGVTVWSRQLRKVAIIAAVVVHGAALLFLGPLGLNYNLVVWPWNIAMPVLLWVLFGTGDYWKKQAGEAATTAPGPPNKKDQKVKSQSRIGAEPAWNLKQTLVELSGSRPALAIVALYSLLPILSYYGKWDSYFSFCLYSDNLASANIFVTQEFADRLPASLKVCAQKFGQTFDPRYQGPLVFNCGQWCMQELRVPPISEPRNFVSIFNALREWSKEPSDLRMVVGQRAGPVIFYEGDSREYLTPQ